MLQKYLVTLAVVVLALTYAASFLTFVTHIAVSDGKVMDEHLTYDLLVDSGNQAYHAVDTTAAQFLGDHAGISTGGFRPAHCGKSDGRPQAGVMDRKQHAAPRRRRSPDSRLQLGHRV
jgi:hypothetical protein